MDTKPSAKDNRVLDGFLGAFVGLILGFILADILIAPDYSKRTLMVIKHFGIVGQYTSMESCVDVRRKVLADNLDLYKKDPNIVTCVEIE